jgi:hypothetical protein
MELSLPTPEAPAPQAPAPEPASRPGGRTLIACIAISVAAFVGTDALARNSDAFWELAEESTSASENAALVLEGQAHRLSNGPRLAALVMGSSVAESNYAMREMERVLGVPRDRVGRLWMPAMSGLELAMLAPTVRELRPERVYVPALPLLMIDEVSWDRTRTYSPRVAMRLFPLGELFADRKEHGSRMLSASHIVVRRRSELRRALLGSFRDVTAMAPREDSPLRDQVAALRRSRDEDFHCDSIHLRALRLFAEELHAVGTTLVLTIAPLTPRSPVSRDAVYERLEQCISELELPSTEVRARATGPAFTERDFRDSIHLTRDGAERFTRWTLGEPADAL